MAVTELGWSTLAQAESYFANERLPVTHWENLADNDEKNRELNAAYNRIYHHPDYSVPAAGDETAAELVYLIKAQSEMAYYLALHLGDEDRRKGLQAQAVTDAGIVKEKYDKDKLGDLPIPPIVDAILDAAGFKDNNVMAMLDIDRDEDESVDYEADNF